MITKSGQKILKIGGLRIHIRVIALRWLDIQIENDVIEPVPLGYCVGLGLEKEAWGYLQRDMARLQRQGKPLTVKNCDTFRDFCQRSGIRIEKLLLKLRIEKKIDYVIRHFDNGVIFELIPWKYSRHSD